MDLTLRSRAPSLLPSSVIYLVVSSWQESLSKSVSWGLSSFSAVMEKTRESVRVNRGACGERRSAFINLTAI